MVYSFFFFFETTHNKGDMTFFGKTAKLLTETEEIGHFEKILYKITAFLLALSLLMTGIIAGYLISQNVNFLEVLAICVVLLVASIPIAMNVVCTSTMALGSRKLSEGKKKNKNKRKILFVFLEERERGIYMLLFCSMLCAVC